MHEIEVRTGVPFAARGETTLAGDLYRPAGPAAPPVLVLLHGGAWSKGHRGAWAPWGRWLAARGYAGFAAQYRLAAAGRPAWPDNVEDVLDAIRFVRREAAALGVDGTRVAAMGGSAGGHLAAMAALTGEAGVRPTVVLGAAGIYDLHALWSHDALLRPVGENPSELYLGGTPATVRPAYFAASPTTHADVARAAGTSWLLAWGTEDDVVPPETQSVALSRHLKRAGATVRHQPLVGAPHYWYLDAAPDDPGTYAEAFGRRALTFLRETAGWPGVESPERE